MSVLEILQWGKLTDEQYVERIRKALFFNAILHIAAADFEYRKINCSLNFGMLYPTRKKPGCDKGAVSTGILYESSC